MVEEMFAHSQSQNSDMSHELATGDMTVPEVNTPTELPTLETQADRFFVVNEDWRSADGFSSTVTLLRGDLVRVIRMTEDGELSVAFTSNLADFSRLVARSVAA